MNLAVRVSRPYGDIQDWVKELKVSKIIVFQHDADEEVSRTHVHMLLIGSVLKPDAMKARYKKLYGDIDKTDWSFVQVFKEDGKPVAITDENSKKFITYMTKGHIVPSLCVGYDPAEVLHLAQLWVDPERKELTVKNGKFVRKSKEIDEVKKKSRRSLIEIMCDRGKDEDINPDDTTAVLAMIRKVLIEHNEVIGMWKVMEYYDAWMMYGHKDNWIHMIARKIELRNSK